MSLHNYDSTRLTLEQFHKLFDSNKNNNVSLDVNIKNINTKTHISSSMIEYKTMSSNNNVYYHNIF